MHAFYQALTYIAATIRYINHVGPRAIATTGIKHTVNFVSAEQIWQLASKIFGTTRTAATTFIGIGYDTLIVKFLEKSLQI